MSEDVLKSYIHAMTIDPETNKPMPKVHTQGGSGGGGDVSFPEDFPDINSLSVLQSIYESVSELESVVRDVSTAVQGLERALDDITNGDVVVKVTIDEPEPEEEDED